MATGRTEIYPFLAFNAFRIIIFFIFFTFRVVFTPNFVWNYRFSGKGLISGNFNIISPKLMQLWILFKFISNKVPNCAFRAMPPNFKLKGVLFPPDSHFLYNFTGWVEARDFWCAENNFIFALQRPRNDHFASPEARAPIRHRPFIVILHQECLKRRISKWRAAKPRFPAKSRFSTPTMHLACKSTRVSANRPKLCLAPQSRQTLHHSTPNRTAYAGKCTVSAKIANIAPKLSFTTRFPFWRAPALFLPAPQSSQFTSCTPAALQPQSPQCPQAPCFVEF